MKTISFFLFFSLAITTVAQINHFPNLQKVDVDKSMQVFIKYESANTQLIQKKLSQLPTNDPQYSDDDMESDNVKVMETTLDVKSKERYIIVYSPGLSADPAFIFYKKSKPEKACFSVGGLGLYLTGNGTFYVTGHINNTFDIHRKFKIENDSILEVKQPFHYVGLKTKTNQPITLFADKEQKEIVAQLPSGCNIEVLLSDTEEDFTYLIKTEFGLIGWTHFDMIFQKDIQIKGLYFRGD